MTSSQEGILLIADITGYTAFLANSELEHAEDTLRNLLTLLIAQTKPPLLISRLEGDAVISYAAKGTFFQGQWLVELIESAYIEFRKARERMVLNTTCPCNACRNIPNLDLKFFVHAGTFMTQPLANYTELIGSDVNLIHRLTKNSVRETTGLNAYALYTQSAIGVLGITDLAIGMMTHREEFEHLGQVQVYVQDLETVWERQREKQNVAVELDNALLVVEGTVPVMPINAWNYLTKPEFRALLFGSDGQSLVSRPGGRIGAGDIYHCAHGNKTFPHTILDWHPYEYYTYEETRNIPRGCRCLVTIRFTAVEGGTRVSVVGGRITGAVLGRIIANTIIPRVGRKLFTEGLARLADQIQADEASNPTGSQPPPKMQSEQIEEAVKEGLSYQE